MEHHISDAAAGWDSARCNRVLRPLATKLASLPGAVRSRSLGMNDENARDSRNLLTPLDSPWSLHDARQVKRTYGRYNRIRRDISVTGSHLSPVSKGLAGGIHVPTPLLKKIRSGAKDENIPNIVGGSTRDITISRRRVKSLSRGSTDKLDGVCSAFEHVLSATNVSPRSKPPGNSLVAMCLRSLPRHMASEQNHRKVLDRCDGSDVPSEVFQILEEYEASTSWLPALVRFQALWLLTDAVDKGVLNVSVMDRLLHIADRYAAADMGAVIVSRFVRREHLVCPAGVNDILFSDWNSRAWKSMLAFSERQGEFGILFRDLAHMVTLDRLPVQWLACASMRPVWNRCITSLSTHDGDHGHALDLVRTLFLSTLGYQSPPNASTKPAHSGNTLSGHQKLARNKSLTSNDRKEMNSEPNLWAALDEFVSGMCGFLVSVAMVAGEGTAMWLSIEGLISNISKATAESYLSPATRSRDLRVGARKLNWVIVSSHVFLATIATSDENNGASEKEMQLLSDQEAMAAPGLSVEMSRLGLSIVRYCERAERGHGAEGLSKWCDFLSKLMSATDSYTCRELLRHAAVDTAIRFAKLTTESKSLQMALRLEESMWEEVTSARRLGRPGTTPGKVRWEEGIGEFVTITPSKPDSLLSQEGSQATEARVGAEDLSDDELL